jgi:hypothetical protein
LAKKYGVDDVVQVIIEYIEDLWPKTLEDWDIFHFTINKRRRSSKETENLLLEPSSVISFAFEFGMQSILPMVYYFLACIGPTRINEDFATSQICWNLLGLDTIMEVLGARDQIRSEFVQVVAAEASCHYPDSGLSFYPSNCDNARSRIALAFISSKELFNGEADCLQLLYDFAVRVGAEQDVCRGCSNDIEGDMEAARHKLFAKIPEILETLLSKESMA